MGERVVVGRLGPDCHQVQKARFAAMRLGVGEGAAGHVLVWRNLRALVEVGAAWLNRSDAEVAGAAVSRSGQTRGCTTWRSAIVGDDAAPPMG